jgi:hypothetical protein
MWAKEEGLSLILAERFDSGRTEGGEEEDEEEQEEEEKCATIGASSMSTSAEGEDLGREGALAMQANDASARMKRKMKGLAWERGI